MVFQAFSTWDSMTMREREREREREGFPCGFPGFSTGGLDDNEREREIEGQRTESSTKSGPPTYHEFYILLYLDEAAF